MITIRGSHGTTVSAAKSVRANGWVPGMGRAGKAVYFWIEDEDGYHLELARGWYRKYFSQGRYNKYQNQLCTILIGTCQTDDKEVLDFDNRVLRRRVDALALENGIDRNDKREVSKIFDKFLVEYEKDRGIKIRIITLEVPPPGAEFCSYPGSILGAPVCCAVKDTRCITKLEEVDC